MIVSVMKVWNKRDVVKLSDSLVTGLAAEITVLALEYQHHIIL